MLLLSMANAAAASPSCLSASMSVKPCKVESQGAGCSTVAQHDTLLQLRLGAPPLHVSPRQHQPGPERPLAPAQECVARCNHSSGTCARFATAPSMPSRDMLGTAARLDCNRNTHWLEAQLTES